MLPTYIIIIHTCFLHTSSSYTHASYIHHHHTHMLPTYIIIIHTCFLHTSSSYTHASYIHHHHTHMLPTYIIIHTYDNHILHASISSYTHKIMFIIHIMYIPEQLQLSSPRQQLLICRHQSIVLGIMVSLYMVLGPWYML